MLAEYEKNELLPYLQRSIFEIPSKSFAEGQEDDSARHLYVCLPGGHILTGHDVCHLRSTISRYLEISEGILQFIGFEDGSIMLIFRIPEALLELQDSIKRHVTFDSVKQVYIFNDNDLKEMLNPESPVEPDESIVMHVPQLVQDELFMMEPAFTASDFTRSQSVYYRAKPTIPLSRSSHSLNSLPSDFKLSPEQNVGNQASQCQTISEHWTTKPDGEIHIKTTFSVSDPASLPPVTVNDAFQQICSIFPDKPALCIKRNDNWNITTFVQYNANVTQAAKSLISLGLEPHHGVCILGFNSPEWFISYLAGIMAGGISVGVYETNSKETCLQIAENCRAQIFFCENIEQMNKILEIKDRLPNLKFIIVQYIPADNQEIDPQHREAGVLSWNDFLALGKDIPDHELSRRIQPQKPGDCASIIYTSGTTGPPKGVMLSHDNLTWSATVMCRSYGLTENDRLVSYLPLSHIAAQMTDIISQLTVGHTVWFAQPDALKGSVLLTLKEVHPTLFLGVPQVWEKIRTAMELRLQTKGRLKTFMVDIAKNIGMKTSKSRQQGDHKPRGYWLSNKLVFRSVRQDLGLDDCKLCCSGGAPLPRAVEDFFYQFDIPICQLYGMSESTAIACMNAPEKFRSQAVGLATSGVELRIDNPGPNNEGEICCRGRNVFMGYLHNDTETGKTIDEAGWLHSGDIGYVDNKGYYFITGRSREIIFTKDDENIAPVFIEERMLESMRLLSNVMVIGDNQPYLTMFVTIKCQTDDYGNPTDELDPFAKLVLDNIGSDASTVPEVQVDPKVSQYIKEKIEHVNENADKKSSHVKNFFILPTDFSINGGELTPTMKMKRNKILEKYQAYVERMYRE